MLEDKGNWLKDLDWQTRLMVKKVAREFHKKTGRGIRLRSGLRSCDRQNAIYAKGRTAPGPIVTNAPGCRSWHVTGRAVDFDPFDPATGKIAPNGQHSDYRLVGDLWKKEGGIWGGDFKNLFDPGHLEWHPKQNIDDICPRGMTCEQFEIKNRAPLYLYVLGGLGAVGVLTLSYFAFLHRK